MSELDTYFERAKAEPTDMQGHMDVIKSYAGQSATIAEFGVYDCTSTWALLAGRPQQLTSYDIARRAEVDDVERVAASSGLSFKFVLADSTAVDIGKVDLLFIDSLHTYGHLTKELAIHAKNVNKWIIMHDTITFGHQDQPDWSNPGPGLWPAVEEFLAANKSWKIHEHFTHFHGLTVLANCWPMDELSVIIPRLTASSTVVEVGANNGQHTCVFANIVKKVIAFEAHPSLTGHHITAVHSNVDWIQKAVSNHGGLSRFNISTSDDGSMINSSSLREIDPKSKQWWPELKFYPIEVETTTLDNEIVAECVDLIWMDVQGAELDVLQGATEILKITKMVSIEFHEGQYCGASSAKDIRDLLLPYGFTETVIAEDRSVFLRHD